MFRMKLFFSLQSLVFWKLFLSFTVYLLFVNNNLLFMYRVRGFENFVDHSSSCLLLFYFYHPKTKVTIYLQISLRQFFHVIISCRLRTRTTVGVQNTGKTGASNKYRGRSRTQKNNAMGILFSYELINVDQQLYFE